MDAHERDLDQTARRYQARELTQLEAVTMAMDGAQDRGRAGDPQAFLDALPWGWALVNTNAVGQLAGTLLDALAGGLDGVDGMTDTPTTEAGRALLDLADVPDRDEMLPHILAVEAEARSVPTRPDGLRRPYRLDDHEHEWHDVSTMGDPRPWFRQICTVPGCGVMRTTGDDPWAELPDQALVPDQRPVRVGPAT